MTGKLDLVSDPSASLLTEGLHIRVTNRHPAKLLPRAPQLYFSSWADFIPSSTKSLNTETLITFRIPDREQKTCSPFLSGFPAVSQLHSSDLDWQCLSTQQLFNSHLAEAGVTQRWSWAVCRLHTHLTVTHLTHTAHDSVPSLKFYPYPSMHLPNPAPYRVQMLSL